jgi:hypothetical protein
MPKVKPLGIDERVGVPTGETAVEKGPSYVQRWINEEARNRTKGDFALRNEREPITEKQGGRHVVQNLIGTSL